MKGQKNVATERHSQFAFILCYKIVLMFYKHQTTINEYKRKDNFRKVYWVS